LLNILVSLGKCSAYGLEASVQASMPVMNRLAAARRNTVYLISLGYSPMVVAIGLAYFPHSNPSPERERGSKLPSPFGKG
jgi:hypothetical protein